MKKPRFRFNSTGWFFGLWYMPDGLDENGRPGRYLWVGPYEAFEEVKLGQSILGILPRTAVK